jgi:type I restriction enzyme, S subunit
MGERGASILLAPPGTTLARGFAEGTRSPWPLALSRNLFELRYGKALVDQDRSPGTVPVYGTNGQCGWHNKGLFPGPGVVLGRKGQGPLGVEWVDHDYWVIDTAYSLVLLTDQIDLKYAYYLIKYIGLNHLKDGTSNPSLSRETFGAQVFPLPGAGEQREIARILTTLDDKIELNRRTNETLEAMARALFKSWFVDFDPVRAKAQGRRPIALASNVAALFPSSFVDSELGQIPEGWAVGTVEDFCLRVAMGPFGSDIKTDNFVDAGVSVVRGGNLREGFLDDQFVFLTEEKAAGISTAKQGALPWCPG